MDLYDTLYKRGYIGYGKIIPVSLLEELIGHKDDHSWNFRGPYLYLQTRLSKNKFFSKGKKGNIYILPKQNMSPNFYHQTKKRSKKEKLEFISVKELDVSDLNENDQTKHYHVFNKAINYINAAKSILDKYLDE